MCRKRVNGDITVLFSLIFIVILSLAAALLESASIQTAKNKKYVSAEIASESIFAEYQKEMLDKYDIFTLDASYGNDASLTANLEQRMEYYGLRGTDLETEGLWLLTDNSGEAFYEQAVRYMENLTGLSYAEKLLGQSEVWEKERQEMETGGITGEQAEETLNKTAEAVNPESSLLQKIIQVGSDSLLENVFPKERRLSDKKLNLQESVSCRQLQTGMGEPGTGRKSGLLSDTLFQEYLFGHFQSAVEESTEQTDSRGIEYELEYLLEGNAGDGENLKAVLSKLRLLRLAANYICLLSDQTRCAEAEAMAVTITSLLLTPEASEALKQGLLVLWSYEESKNDLKILMMNGKVPIRKESRKWQTSLLDAVNPFGEKVPEVSESQAGLSYKDYLRVLMFTVKKTKLSMRALDLIETNLRISLGQPFYADRCANWISVKVSAQFRRHVNYTFQIENRYW